jgi:hypothetical protein
MLLIISLEEMTPLIKTLIKNKQLFIKTVRTQRKLQSCMFLLLPYIEGKIYTKIWHLLG